MKVHICLLSVLVLFGGCSRASRFTTALGHGATFVARCTVTPGFLEQSIEWDYTLVWPGGRRESLPRAIPFLSRKDVSLQVLPDSVWIWIDSGIVMREGGVERTDGRWHAWSVATTSDAQFEYMDHVAMRANYVGVHKTTYTIPKRMSANTVSDTETETLTTLRYEAKSRENGLQFFISPTYHTGWWLPHRIQRIDFATQVIYCVSLQSVESMPDFLVFSPSTERAGEWLFDRDRSEAQDRL